MMDPVLAQRAVHEQQMVALQREMANSMALAGRTPFLQHIDTYKFASWPASLALACVLTVVVPYVCGITGLGQGRSGGGLGNGSAHSPRGRSGAGVNAMDIDEMVVDLMPYVNTSSFVVGCQSRGRGYPCHTQVGCTDWKS
jgi:hypothetical protein